jgi:hypothetical protein
MYGPHHMDMENKHFWETFEKDFRIVRNVALKRYVIHSACKLTHEAFVHFQYFLNWPYQNIDNALLYFYKKKK